MRGLKIRDCGSSLKIEPAGKLLKFLRFASAKALRGPLSF